MSITNRSGEELPDIGVDDDDMSPTAGIINSKMQYPVTWQTPS